MTEKENIIWKTSHITADNGTTWEVKTPLRFNPDTGKMEKVKGQISRVMTELEVLKLNKNSVLK